MVCAMSSALLQKSSPPEKTSEWVELLETVFQSKPHTVNTVDLGTLLRRKFSIQTAHDFIEASFRLKDTHVLNTPALTQWAEMMQYCLDLQPSNRAVGLEVGKHLLNRVHSIDQPVLWPTCCEKWTQHFIGTKDYAMVKSLWGMHHFNGNGKDLVKWAIYTGDVKMVEIFLDRIDPRVNKNELLMSSIYNCNLPIFERLFIDSPFKNKTQVLHYALDVQHPYRIPRRRRKLNETETEKAQRVEKEKEKNKILECMIARLIPQSDINNLFFAMQISADTQWMIEYLSKKSMARLKKDPYHNQVKDLPAYQQRILNESIGAVSFKKHSRKI